MQDLGCDLSFSGRYTWVVTKAATKVLTEALALTPEERMDLAAELLASVDGPADPDWEQAWQAELDRRAAASDASTTPPAEWSDVRARVLGKLASR
jgi:putative addiction module component (TIGR02574 family)